MLNKFGERVKCLLEENHMTKGELAQELKISRSTLSNYCSGRVQPPADIIIMTAQYFAVTTDYVLGLGYNFIEYYE